MIFLRYYTLQRYHNIARCSNSRYYYHMFRDGRTNARDLHTKHVDNHRTCTLHKWSLSTVTCTNNTRRPYKGIISIIDKFTDCTFAQINDQSYSTRSHANVETSRPSSRLSIDKFVQKEGRECKIEKLHWPHHGRTGLSEHLSNYPAATGH